MTTEQKKMEELQAELERLRKSAEQKKPNDIIVIKGNRFLKWLYCGLFNFYNKIAQKYSQKKLEYSDKEFKLKEFKFESPRLILITFTDLLENQDYEVSLHSQTAYLKYYKQYQQTNKIPDLIRIDEFIKNNHKTAIKI